MYRILLIAALMFNATPGIAEDSAIYTERQFGFPGGRSKALVLSYDDGPTQDRRFVALLNEHGIKGTFNINSGRLGLEAEWMTELIGDPGWYVKAEELATLYAGHEIASHTVNHPHLPELESTMIRDEIMRDVELLQDLVGYDVVSFAYPFGEFDDRIVGVLDTTGITNARTVESTSAFDLPDDFLRWHPTAHHSHAMALVDEFFASDVNEPALFMLWGHSWEFDGDTADNNWDLAKALCEQLSGHDDVWYAGAAEFVRYVDAVKRLDKAGDDWVNRSGETVWIRDGGELRELSAR